MVWFEISGFGDAINMGSSPGVLLVILLLPCVTEILQDQPLCVLQRFIDGVAVGTGQLKALDLGLGGG